MVDFDQKQLRFPAGLITYRYEIWFHENMRGKFELWYESLRVALAVSPKADDHLDLRKIGLESIWGDKTDEVRFLKWSSINLTL